MTHYRLVTIKEACARTSLSRSTLWRLAKDGAFPSPITISGARKAFVAEELDSWVEQRMVERPTCVQ
jgi:prophage regulatory protein